MNVQYKFIFNISIINFVIIHVVIGCIENHIINYRFKIKKELIANISN
jgi:hypothetical protein